jgi:hypothetical protein
MGGALHFAELEGPQRGPDSSFAERATSDLGKARPRRDFERNMLPRLLSVKKKKDASDNGDSSLNRNRTGLRRG